MKIMLPARLLENCTYKERTKIPMHHENKPSSNISLGPPFQFLRLRFFWPQPKCLLSLREKWKFNRSQIFYGILLSVTGRDLRQELFIFCGHTTFSTPSNICPCALSRVNWSNFESTDTEGWNLIHEMERAQTGKMFKGGKNNQSS